MGNIGYPPLRPAKWFTDRFNLNSDYELRSWNSAESCDQPVLKSLVWGRKSGQNDHNTPETGSRLLANRVALKTWLKNLKMELIVEIQIDREFKRDSYQYKQDDSPSYLPSYTLLVIFKSDGKIETI